MVTPLNRHDFLNHKSAIISLLQEIPFVDPDKANKIYLDIKENLNNYLDFSYIYEKENRLGAILFGIPKAGFPEIGKTVEIKYLVVRKDLRGQSIAKELAQYFISLVKFNYANILLSCYEHNQEGINFYRKLGFHPYKISGHVQRELKDANTEIEHEDILFLRRLPLRNILIRPLRTSNSDFLKEMVFQSLYSDGELFDREILNEPGIAKYYRGWDSKREIGYIARYEDKDIGAIWCRQFPFYDPGYGFVDDSVPEMGVAVFPEYRGRGLGQLLIEHLINRLIHLRFKAVSLSVHHKNPARILYERYGFVMHRNTGDSITMVKKLA